MNKKILLVFLICSLLIISFAIAPSLALYSVNMNDFSGDINARTFDLAIPISHDYFDLELNKGESFSYGFFLINSSNDIKTFNFYADETHSDKFRISFNNSDKSETGVDTVTYLTISIHIH